MHRIWILLVLLSPCIVHAELDISDAWIKNLPASIPVRAGYMTLHNRQAEAMSIVGVRSDAFAAVELHETLEQDGMMRMQPIPTITVAPGATIQLAPGGIHLMMMQPNSAVRPQARIGVTLEFSNGREQQLEMTVRN